jgi:hypothetical protein
MTIIKLSLSFDNITLSKYYIVKIFCKKIASTGKAIEKREHEYIQDTSTIHMHCSTT